MQLKCPCCKCYFEEKKESFPFCSPECQNADLGKWATESYSIPAVEPPTESELVDLINDDTINQH